MEETDELLENAAAHERSFSPTGLSASPSKAMAVVACMDARLDPVRVLSLAPGDAHVIRNAGGVVTDDVIRSLMLSQQLLGTRQVVLIHHTDCGLHGTTDDEIAERVATSTGVRPTFAMESFNDIDDSVRRSIERLHATPFVKDQQIRGFVYDVETGHLRQVQ